jgi:CRP-like cAMP-binding protein
MFAAFSMPVDFSAVPLFGGHSAAELDAVVSAAHHVTRDHGGHFFEQGGDADAFYVLTEGRLKITQITPEGHQVVLRLIGPGSPFGGVAAFARMPYPVGAEAIEPSAALAWDGRTMARLLETHARLAVNALQFVASQLREVQDRYRELVTEKVERRVARTLIRLAHDTGKKVEAGVLIDTPLSREDLAEMTGTTIYTVSRLIAAWEEKGLVEGGRQRVLIRRLPGLARIADDV